MSWFGNLPPALPICQKLLPFHCHNLLLEAAMSQSGGRAGFPYCHVGHSRTFTARMALSA